VRGYLEPGEEVRINERPHGAALAKPMGRALALAIAGAVVVLVGSSLTWGVAAVGALLVAAGAVAAFVAVWRWDRTHVVLTSQKLFVVYGLAQRRAAAVRLARVDTVELEQSPLGRALDYGTIVAGDLEIPFVADPRRICRLTG
jgi:uncharacterized membrane protein YdbT with pleckstrin-like domain